MSLTSHCCKTTLQRYINFHKARARNMENTFDINDYKDRHGNPASFPQCRAIGLKFAKKGNVMNWRLQKQITGCLYGLAKENKLTFKKADSLLKGKTLPKAYFDKIKLYLEQQES